MPMFMIKFVIGVCYHYQCMRSFYNTILNVSIECLSVFITSFRSRLSYEA